MANIRDIMTYDERPGFEAELLPLMNVARDKAKELNIPIFMAACPTSKIGNSGIEVETFGILEGRFSSGTSYMPVILLASQRVAHDFSMAQLVIDTMLMRQEAAAHQKALERAEIINDIIDNYDREEDDVS